MASQALFETVPAFPDHVPTLPMHTVSLAKLTSGDAATAKSLLRACQELGFFLLDLRGDGLGEMVIKEIDGLFAASKDIMNLPDEIKDNFQHDLPKSFLGFKPRGVARTETNEPDRFEWFNVGQDGLMGNSDPQLLPKLVTAHLPLYTSFLQHGQTIASAINTTLAIQLGLPSNTFSSLQSPTKPSGTVVRLIKAYASPEHEDLRTSMIHHTDFGTITLLANVLGGLQVLGPGKAATEKDAWLYVRPQPGRLIVNLGDAMVQWSGGLLRSNVHRINFAPGQQRFVDRYSLAILFRPERDASMRRLIGESEGEDSQDGNLTAWEWEVKKAMSLKRGDSVMESKGGRQIAAAST
ncbi:oxidoreductase [Phaeosphaeriaceae sp. PMI808]|nr:oxidoreductase [Phaeosphaeriaceae sp. PMI808]